MRTVLGACALGAAAACASAGRPAPSESPSVIRKDEIASAHASTAYQVVERLRGHYLLRMRGATSVDRPESALPTVYVDGVEYGDLSALRALAASDVEEIRFVSAWDAATKYGGRHLGGVVEVRTSH